MNSYNKFNFHKHTFCLFQQVEDSAVADLKLGYKSASGSAYYYSEIGVYRKSNHWGRTANCRWRLITNADYKNQTEIVGFAKWTDFHPNNDTEKLFFTEINEAKNEVHFNHKNHPNYAHQIVRNASDTAKRIKEIKNVLQTTSWAKHLIFDDFEEIKRKMLTELSNTNESFVNLKKILQHGKK
ncbi:hypothetical protein [Flavobacterium sp.]|jgi:hypothetical protein|uniref:hypothetical protein n=1 Tax=Flavobacterium sp. TaxID=239 RepID=UPI0037C0AC63